MIATIAPRMTAAGGKRPCGAAQPRSRNPCGSGSRKTASSHRASGTMGFATTLRQCPTSGRCRGAPCNQKRPNPKWLDSSAPRSAIKQGRGVVVSDGGSDAAKPQVTADVIQISFIRDLNRSEASD
jgi:hypothetical protein